MNPWIKSLVVQATGGLVSLYNNVWKFDIHKCFFSFSNSLNKTFFTFREWMVAMRDYHYSCIYSIGNTPSDKNVNIYLSLLVNSFWSSIYIAFILFSCFFFFVYAHWKKEKRSLLKERRENLENNSDIKILIKTK